MLRYPPNEVALPMPFYATTSYDVYGEEALLSLILG